MGDNDKMTVAKIYTPDVEVGSVAVPGTMRKDLSRRHINMIGLAVSCSILARHTSLGPIHCFAKQD
jgi:hypothetical protein